MLLAVVVFVPTLARLHQHVGTSTDEGPRFRWSTSCDSVPKRATATTAAALAAIVAGTTTNPPARRAYARPAADPLPAACAPRSAQRLRAPPAHIA
jgi:hypothetical protein